MEGLKSALHIKQVQFGKILSYSLLINMILYLLISYGVEYFFNYRMALSRKVIFGALIGVSYVSYLISNTEFEFKKVYRIVALSLFVMLLYIGLSICHRSLTVFLFFIPLGLMIYMLVPLRKAILCSIIMICCTIWSTHISEFLHITTPLEGKMKPTTITRVLQVIIGVFSTYYFFLVLYYLIEMTKIEIEMQTLNQLMHEDQKRVESTGGDQYYSDDDLKFKILYEEIIDFLNTKKPYQNSEFNKKILAKQLDTNETYISIALNRIGNISFHKLINEYRINQVKEEFLNNNHKNFTVEYIYTKAGFSQQSTFNRVFKDTTGQTPTNFIESIENSNNKKA